MGRHSAPDDDDDDGVIAAGDTVVVAPPAGANRPRPGRHSRAADDVDIADGGDSGEENTAQITPIVDPVLDEPLPAAMTTVIAPVPDDEPAAEGGLVDDLLADPDTPPDDEQPAAPTTKKGKAPKPSKANKPPKAAKQPKSPKPPKPPKPAKGAKPSGAGSPVEADPAAPPVVEAAAAETAAAETVVIETAAVETTAVESPTMETAAVAPPIPDQPLDLVAPAELSPAEATSLETDKPTKRPEPHVSDRTLLARDSAARARVIAAVVVPFVLYVAVLLVLDEFELRTILIWIWLPLITAGVVAGLILDLAHRAAAARAITALEDKV